MKRIFQARLYFYSVGLIISSAIERIITSIINDHFHLNSISYHVFSMITLIISFIIINILLKSFIHKDIVSQWTLGKEYIGGRWIEIVLTEKNEISHITKMDISYDVENIKIQADTYCYKTGKHLYDFHSVCASYDEVGHKLTYGFIAEEKGKKRHDIGVLTFESTARNKLNKYHGSYKDKDLNFNLFAILISDKTITAKMDIDFIKTCEEEGIVKKLIDLNKLDVLEK